jgi:Fe-Mn family superoxide dismutase
MRAPSILDILSGALQLVSEIRIGAERSFEMGNDVLSSLDRREFLQKAGTAGAALALTLGKPGRIAAQGQAASSISLPPLPYAQSALEPYISGNTISFHYGRHHQAYVNNTVKMIAGTGMENASLEEIIKKTAGRADQTGLFNNAAQVFNHTFYWKSMKPGGGGEPQGKTAAMIKESFGSYQKFMEAFSGIAASQFGSGWAWLVFDGGKLQVTKTSNADTPIATQAKPLITIDVWEHAYYLDYMNRRADYIKAFVEKLLNWDFAEANLA